MLRITADVNGRQIGQVAIVNTGDRNKWGETLYVIHDCEEIDAGESVLDGEKLGEVWHLRQDGAATLISLAMEEINEL